MRETEGLSSVFTRPCTSVWWTVLNSLPRSVLDQLLLLLQLLKIQVVNFFTVKFSYVIDMYLLFGSIFYE